MVGSKRKNESETITNNQGENLSGHNMRFLMYNLEKNHGKEYANAVSEFKYNLLRHYGIHYSLAQRCRRWTLNHIIQLINSNYDYKVIAA